MGTSEGGNNAEVVRVAAQRFPLDAHHRRGCLRLRKDKAIVKVLALALGHRLHGERVLDLLWPNLGRLRPTTCARPCMSP